MLPTPNTVLNQLTVLHHLKPHKNIRTTVSQALDRLMSRLHNTMSMTGPFMNTSVSQTTKETVGSSIS